MDKDIQFLLNVITLNERRLIKDFEKRIGAERAELDVDRKLLLSIHADLGFINTQIMALAKLVVEATKK